MSAIEAWKQRVSAHQAQSRRAQAALGQTVMDKEPDGSTVPGEPDPKQQESKS